MLSIENINRQITIHNPNYLNPNNQATSTIIIIIIILLHFQMMFFFSEHQFIIQRVCVNNNVALAQYNHISTHFFYLFKDHRHHPHDHHYHCQTSHLHRQTHTHTHTHFRTFHFLFVLFSGSFNTDHPFIHSILFPGKLTSKVKNNTN